MTNPVKFPRFTIETPDTVLHLRARSWRSAVRSAYLTHRVRPDAVITITQQE